MKYSVIDIGSNSVRLMTWADGTTLYKRLLTTRLGEGIADTRMLRADAIERTACAVAEFYAQAREDGAEVHAFATAAVRSAKNGGEFCARVRELCGLAVEVVTGETEAQLALSGALGKRDGAVIDIGGASTEVCTRTEGKCTFAVSLDVGAVRLFDRCGDDAGRLKEEIGRLISPLAGLSLPQPIYAVGGTATAIAALMQGLARYRAEKINDFRMPFRQVRECAEELLGLTASERVQLKGMDVNRADIIAGGALLLSMLMETLGADCVFASDRDNLEGYLTEKIL